MASDIILLGENYYWGIMSRMTYIMSNKMKQAESGYIVKTTLKN